MTRHHRYESWVRVRRDGELTSLGPPKTGPGSSRTGSGRHPTLVTPEGGREERVPLGCGVSHSDGPRECPWKDEGTGCPYGLQGKTSVWCRSFWFVVVETRDPGSHSGGRDAERRSRLVSSRRRQGPDGPPTALRDVRTRVRSVGDVSQPAPGTIGTVHAPYALGRLSPGREAPRDGSLSVSPSHRLGPQ